MAIWPVMATTRPDVSQRLAEIGRRFDQRGWMLGTSGNFSGVVEREPLRLAITPSGTSKGELSADQILEIDATGAVTHGIGAPSAEARLHVEVVRARGAGAVLHTHSIWSTLLSDRHAATGGLAIEGYEMLKGLEGVTTHEHREWIPILENDQDMTRLAGRRPGRAQPESGLPRVPPSAPRDVHLGRLAGAGRAPRRDCRVPARSRRPGSSERRQGDAMALVSGGSTMALIRIPAENTVAHRRRGGHGLPCHTRHRLRAVDARPAGRRRCHGRGGARGLRARRSRR